MDCRRPDQQPLRTPTPTFLVEGEVCQCLVRTPPHGQVYCPRGPCMPTTTMCCLVLSHSRPAEDSLACSRLPIATVLRLTLPASRACQPVLTVLHCCNAASVLLTVRVLSPLLSSSIRPFCGLYAAPLGWECCTRHWCATVCNPCEVVTPEIDGHMGGAAGA
jgi:hypothetical protein